MNGKYAFVNYFLIQMHTIFLKAFPVNKQKFGTGNFVNFIIVSKDSYMYIKVVSLYCLIANYDVTP